MKSFIAYVHGKGGSAQEAEHYKMLFPRDEVIGFDYHAQTPWEAKKEFLTFFTEQRNLYGEHDGLTSIETVSAFAKRHHAELTVMPGGEHWFHTEEQMRFLDQWIREQSRKDDL